MPRAQERTPEHDTEPGTHGIGHRLLRWSYAAVGLLFLGVAGFANYSPVWIFAAHWKVFVRFPGMLPSQYYFFPVWYVIIGLPAILFAACLVFPSFRHAVRAPWRKAGLAVPLLVSAVLFAISMIPAEYLATKTQDTGTRMVFYLVVAGTGLTLFLAGAYRLLRFLDAPMERAEKWIFGLDQRLFMLLLFGVTFLITNLISCFVFEHMPHVQDSIAQLFQARVFAQGKLFLQSPRFPDFFDYTHVINEGRWYSQYSFMHPLFLMLGVFVGAPWIINPLLGALTVPLFYLLGRDLYGERIGRIAGLLGCLTPFLLNMSSEFMNHSTSLLFATLFLLFFFRTVRGSLNTIPGTRKPEEGGGWIYAVIAGVALGIVADVRPYTALAFAAPLAAYGLYVMARKPGRYFPRFLVMVLCAAAVTSLVFIYNWLTNGDPFLWGYVVKWGPDHEIGFGHSAWGDFHTPYRGLINTLNSLNQTNKFVFEWPIPSLIPIALLFASGTRDKKDWLLFSGFASLLVAFFFYWFQNSSFGPRFLYASTPCLLLLTVRGVHELRPFLRRTCDLQVSDESVGRFVRRVWPVLTAVALGIGLPPLLSRVYHGYYDVSGDLARTVRKTKLENAVVFCKSFGNGFSFNALGLDGNVVYAKDYGMLNAALTLSYPDRQYYYGSHDTLRQLSGISYPQSRLKRALDEMDEFLQDTMTLTYRTVIWPFKDIPPSVKLSTEDSGPGPRLVDLRTISREIFTGKHQFGDYLPALACWMVNDDREHLRVFSFMNDLQNVLAGGYKFTLLLVTSGGTGAVFDISTATGREVTVPRRVSPVPLR